MYYPLPFLDLNNIQDDFLATFTLPEYQDSILYYPNNAYNFLLNSKEIKNALQLINITLDDVLGLAIISINSGVTIPVHIDIGNYTYSLNIPISGYSNTYTKFYVANTKPTMAGKHSGRLYAKWMFEECEEIYSFEAKSAYIMNTSVPHSVINNSELVRICLLLRIKNSSNSKIMVGAQRIEL